MLLLAASLGETRLRGTRLRELFLHVKVRTDWQLRFYRIPGDIPSIVIKLLRGANQMIELIDLPELAAQS